MPILAPTHDSATTSNARILAPWNYDLPVLAALVFFLLTAIGILFWNVHTLRRVLAVRDRDKHAASLMLPRPAAPVPPGTPATTTTSTTAVSMAHFGAKGHAPGAVPWWTKPRLAKLQLIAGIMHVTNQVNFVVHFFGRDMDCAWEGSVADALYVLMVLPSSAVLILQSTMLVPAWRRPYKRALLFLLVAVAMGLIAVSTAMLTWDRDVLAASGVCSIVFNRMFSTAGKAVLVVMYLIILLVLVRPMLVFVILLVTLASVFGLLNYFGRHFTLEMSIQSVGTVVASTLALERLRPADRADPWDESTPTADRKGGDIEAGFKTPAISLAIDLDFDLESPARAGERSLRIDLSPSEAAATVAKLVGSPPARDLVLAPVAQWPGHLSSPTAASAVSAASKTRVPSAESTSSLALVANAGSTVALGEQYFSTQSQLDDDGVEVPRRVASGVWVEDAHAVHPTGWIDTAVPLPYTSIGHRGNSASQHSTLLVVWARTTSDAALEATVHRHLPVAIESRVHNDIERVEDSQAAEGRGAQGY
ncbi:hypothetical protein AMAG_01118 [Allomyces macrogynus ATCC 38327]|uniref:Uncharacterized protein n=1 Tax=Allomyces macrogynus (strain ATCC 38327) TaxID=578462 RepID=A0A0L0RXT5_ALLM3|nr:hypothetical protein AMAG_01118 [Allomyces macrogynus ATCC 38327]|eukprot:KNE55202.1 hypothetical protein AMAG_01118 [Allomyces macrogynus ATCC 38327]